MTTLAPAYTYRATFLRAVDGDTIDVLIDLGFHVRLEARLRLAGIDTPERKGVTAEAGLAAREFTRAWCTRSDLIAERLVIVTLKDRGEKYGRFLARVYWNASGESLNDALVAAGHAKPYDGGARTP